MSRTKQTVALIAALPFVFAAWSTASAFRSDSSRFTTLTITMDGASERPKAVKTEATGTAKFSYNGASPISFSIVVKNLSSKPTGAHIHGPAGVDDAAGVIVGLPIDSAVFSGGIATGTVALKAGSPVSLDSLKKLMQDGKVYVNVHTEKNPGGEIRGQFKP